MVAASFCKAWHSTRMLFTDCACVCVLRDIPLHLALAVCRLMLNLFVYTGNGKQLADTVHALQNKYPDIRAQSWSLIAQ